MDHGSTTGERRPAGPLIKAVPFRHAATGLAIPLLSDAERGRLALIATVVHIPRGTILYERGDHLVCIYDIIHGVVKTYASAADGSRIILAFLFPGDLIGLAENDRYVNTAEAVTSVTAYRLPIEALERLLRRDPELELHFLSKVCHELRAAQRHTILLARQDARGRVALFLHLLRGQRMQDERHSTVLALPMRRSDIADYVGLSVEAVSRALRGLERDRILRFRDPRTIELVNLPRFDRLVEPTPSAAP